MLARVIQDRVMRDVDDIRTMVSDIKTRILALEASTVRVLRPDPAAAPAAQSAAVPADGKDPATLFSILDATMASVITRLDANERERRELSTIVDELRDAVNAHVRNIGARPSPVEGFTINTSERIALSEVEPLPDRPLPVRPGDTIGYGAWVVYTSRTGTLSSRLVTTANVVGMAGLTSIRVNGDDWNAIHTPCAYSKVQGGVLFKWPGHVSDGELLTMAVTVEPGYVYYLFIRVRTVMKSLMGVYCAHVAHLSSRQDTLVVSLGTPVAIVGLPGDASSASEAKYHDVECWFINDDTSSIDKLVLRVDDGVMMYTPPRAGSYRFCATSGNGSTDTLALRKNHLQRIVVIDESLESELDKVN